MPGKDSPASEEKDLRPPRPERSQTHTGTTWVGGQQRSYRVTAATLNLKDDKGEDRASLFHVAYTLDVDNPSTRPVTFCFNGGPGSSAVWLHLGAFGPRRLELEDTLAAPPPPHELVDNLDGMLDQTDLVFIDPVGTGFSRAIGEAKDEDFHGVESDVEALAELIWRWLARHGRFNSPRFLAGESYGTTRSAALALALQERGISLNGLVLLSLAMDFQTFHFRIGHSLPHALYLPTYAATAAYHGHLEPAPTDLEAFLDEVRRYAIDTYLPALVKGTSLSPAHRDARADELARFTGLDRAELARRELRIPYLWFARTLLGRGPRTVGRLDSRYVGVDVDPHATSMARDPSYDAAIGAYTAVINDYLRRELGWESEDEYRVLSMDVNQGWKWQDAKTLDRVSTADRLRKAMVANPHLRVIFCTGRYDLATPFFAAEYTAHHLCTTRDDAERVEIAEYDAGHMMYFHPPSRAKLRQDLLGFYARALS